MSSEPVLKIIKKEDIPKDCSEPVDPVALSQAAAILEGVKKGGAAAAKETAVKLNDLTADLDVYVTKQELSDAFASLSEAERGVLERTAERVRVFAESQRNSISDMTVCIPGGKAGHTVTAVSTAGCYAPGGRYPLPSSVLMTAVTAKAAGVKNVWVASPRPSPVTLGAAHVAGADGFIRIGGAQAIGMFADVLGCDVVVGPGNKWVTAAKSIVQGQGKCTIDMLAGPSEVLVIADDTAEPATIAADLLAQAEHDVESRPILVTVSQKVADSVNQELQKQLAILPTAETARVAVQKGFCVVVDSIDEAIAVSDSIGPEHLEIQTEDADAVGRKCDCYGGLFIGKSAAEVLGDYGAGPNHVLPTGGTARYTGGLSVLNFLRTRTWMRIDEPSQSQVLVKDAVQLARLEGLEGHARAAEARLTP